LGDLRVAVHHAAAAGFVDELPGFPAGRIGEGGAAGLGAHRLRRFALADERFHARADDLGRIERALKHGVDIDDVFGRRVAVGETHFGTAERDHAAGRIPGVRFDEEVFELAAVTAGVHGERAADGAGNAAQEFQAGDAEVGGRTRHSGIEGSGAGANARFGDALDLPEGGGQADDDAFDAAVADEQVRADTDGGDGNVGGLFGHEVAEVVDVDGTEKNLRRSRG